MVPVVLSKITLPLAALLTPVMDKASPSTSLSLDNRSATVKITAVSSLVVPVSSIATGASFSAPIARLTMAVLVVVPSLRS